MRKILLILLGLISLNSFAQLPTMPMGAKVADSSLWKINGANIYNKNTGNAGVGTTTPLAKLHVDAGGGLFTGSQSFVTGTTGVHIGTAASQPTIGLRNNAGALDSKQWDFYASATKLFGRAVNDANTIESKWLEVTRVGGAINNVSFPTGNVGIGTITPIEKLHVIGNAIFYTNGAASAINPLQIQTGQATTDKRLYVQTGAIELQSNETNATLPVFKINSSGTYRLVALANGNVGIGTTTPTDKLSVYNSKVATATATPDAINLGGTFSNSAGNNLKLKLFDDGANIGGLGISAGQMYYKVWATNAAHVYYAGASEVMRITGTGRASINNIAAPLNTLHIGTPAVANTGGVRLPITSASVGQVGYPIGVNASGDVVILGALTQVTAATAAATLTQTSGTTWAVSASTTPATGAWNLNPTFTSYTQEGNKRYYSVRFYFDSDPQITFGVTGAKDVALVAGSGAATVSETTARKIEVRRSGVNTITIDRDDATNAVVYVDVTFMAIMN